MEQRFPDYNTLLSEYSYLKKQHTNLLQNIGNGFVRNEVLLNEEGKAMDYRILEINPAFEQLTGLSKNILNKTFKEVFPKLDDSWIEILNKIAIEQQSLCFVKYCQSQDKWFHITAYPSNSNEFIILLSNLTQIKEIYDELNNKETKFAALAENSPDVIWMSTPGIKQMLYINPAYENIWGKSVQSLYENPQSFIESVHPEDQEMLKKGIQGHEKGQWNYYYRIIKPDGSIRWIEDKGTPIINKKGELCYLCGFARDITENKEMLSKFKRERDFNRKITEISPVGITIEDKDGKTIYVNNQAEHIFKTPKDVILGRSYNSPIWQMTDLSDNPMHNKEMPFYQVKSNGKPLFHTHCRLHLKDGTKLTLSINTAPLSDEKNHFNGAINIISDITEQIKMEASLRENEERWEFAIEGSGDGVWDWDIETDKVFYSKKWKAILGYADSEISNQLFEWGSRLHPEDKESTLKAMKQLLNNEIAAFQFPHRLLCKNNQYKWILGRGKIVKRNESNKPIRIVGTMTDISRQKQMEEELKEREATLSSIFNVAPIGIGFVIHRVLKNVNQTMCNMTGYSREELINQSALILYPDQNEYNKVGEIKYKDISIKGTGTLETQWKKKNGVIINVLLSSTALDTTDLSKGVIFTALDITQSKQDEINLKKTNKKLHQAYEEVQHSNRLKTEFLRTISHELRTPLNGILGFTELLVSDPRLADDQKNYIHYINQSGLRLLNIIQDLLDVSKLEKGMLAIQIEEVETSVLIDEIILDVIKEAENKGIKLNVVLHKNVPKTIRTDKTRYSQVVINLLDNAIKFTSKGKIDLSLYMEYNQLITEVRDSGIGIPRKDLSRIFEPFTQLESDDKRNFGGSGIGLSISSKIALLLGGQLSVESEESKGSTFRFYLPLHFPEMPNKIQSETVLKKHSSSHTKQTILIVEDDAISLKLIQRLLMKEYPNARLIIAHNGKEALAIVKKQSVDLILMDIKLPIVNGLKATQILKTNPVFKSIPIIAITAYASKEDKENYLKSGFDGFVSKPLNRKQLVKMINDFVVL